MTDPLDRIASLVADYRAGEIPQITASHVERWIDQFPSNSREAIAGDMEILLGQYYLSRSSATTFLRDVLGPGKLLGDDPEAALRETVFLDLQETGNSQRDLLDLVKSLLPEMYGKRALCNVDRPVRCVYIDDGVFTGSTLLGALARWRPEPTVQRLDLVHFANHSESDRWIDRQSLQGIESRGIEVHSWRVFRFENIRRERSRYDCLWPTHTDGDTRLDAYIAALEKDRRCDVPWFRPSHMPARVSQRRGRLPFRDASRVPRRGVSNGSTG